MLNSEIQFQGNTLEVVTMIDSGATGNFIDANYCSKLNIPTIKKKKPESVRAVDGTMLTSGLITHQTQSILLRCGQHSPEHQEEIYFDLIDAPQFGIILGMPWLTLHNPIIKWIERKVLFSSDWCQKNCLASFQKKDICSNTHVIATAEEQNTELPVEYQEFKDIFCEKSAEVLPPHRDYDCQIDLVAGAKIPCSRIYALTEKENDHLRAYLDKFLENGFIRPSKSPAASPLFFVPKSNGELRTCIDYWALNNITIKNQYPLPLIPVLIDQVKTATVYTKLDLRGAYHLVRVSGRRPSEPAMVYLNTT